LRPRMLRKLRTMCLCQLVASINFGPCCASSSD
jgi:hypothetical protein